MGLRRENGGYSASVEGYFVCGGEHIRLAKTNGCTFVFTEPRELSPGTTGELLVIVDGKRDSRLVVLPRGVAREFIVEYEVLAPF